MGHPLLLMLKKPRTRKPRPSLTDAQRDRLSNVLKALHREYGSWRRLAEEMDYCEDALKRVVRSGTGSMIMAVRAAELSKVSLETLLSGAPAPGQCPHCGGALPPR